MNYNPNTVIPILKLKVFFLTNVILQTFIRLFEYAQKIIFAKKLFLR